MPHAAAWRILAPTPRGRHDKENSGMSDQDAFDRILAALHAASLDDSQWPATSALIDDAIGSQGNTLLVGAGPPTTSGSASSGSTTGASAGPTSSGST